MLHVYEALLRYDTNKVRDRNRVESVYHGNDKPDARYHVHTTGYKYAWYQKLIMNGLKREVVQSYIAATNSSVYKENDETYLSNALT